MFRSSSLAGESPNRAFAVQAALILLPVAILALLAFTALRADRQQAEKRAREQATLTVRSLGLTTAERLTTLLQRYERTRRDVFPQLPGYPDQLPLAPGTPLGIPRSPALLPSEGVPPTDWVLPPAGARWTSQGKRLQPRPFPPSPQPPAWWIDLDSESRRRWEAARHLESTNAPRAEIIAAFEHCREVVTNPLFDANVLFQLRRLSATNSSDSVQSLLNFAVDPSIHSPAGLPVAALVLFDILAQAPNLNDLILERLGGAVGTYPSLLTPLLLDEADRLAGTNASTRRTLEHLRTRWLGDQQLRALLPSPFATSPRWEWTAAPSFFVERIPQTLVHQRPDGGTLTFNSVQARLISEGALQFYAQQALSETPDWVPVPAYARLELSLLDRRLDSGSRTEAPVLAQWTVSEDPAMGDLAQQLPWQFRLVLEQPELLFADQQRRESWTALLILTAVISAGFGVWQAHRTLRRQLALNEEKSNFVSAVSHELRSPLASVRLLAEGLAQGQVTDETQRRQYGGFLVEETRRLGALVENILNFARIEGGRAQYEFAPTDARRLVRETVDRLQPLAQERSLQLQTTDLTGTSPLEPIWDGLAVQLALTNLIDNALKHAPPSSAVTVTLETWDSRVLLSVADTGPGIPPEDHERIFERFYRRGSELRRETRGVGLGLALVKHLAEAHGGQVLVRSQVGQGATFTLELPLAGPKPAR